MVTFLNADVSDSLFIAKELLGRPTDRSITIRMMAVQDVDIKVSYGLDAGALNQMTAEQSFSAYEPINIVLNDLKPNASYSYRVHVRPPGEKSWIDRPIYNFVTQKPPGSTFTFAVHADPHLDEQSDTLLYKLTMANTLQDHPDFLIDLGDNFMTDKIPVIYPGREINEQEIENRCLLLRSYYERICHSIPLFLALGNHEGEAGWNLDGTAENMAVWTTQQRKLYFANPRPDNFYSGDETQYDFVGLRESYYSWQWGDALFIVLDPYWHTINKPGKHSDNWEWTLGKSQYDWLRRTLESSDAAFKFVFCHQLVGGGDTEGRGGSESAHLYEMGGHDPDGTWAFDAKRPGWGKPLHQLFVENNVAIFFHGHDHGYAKQELDGVIYQLVPQPSHPKYKNAKHLLEYGYEDGVIVPNSGHLRVSVTPENVVVDYVRAFLPETEGDGRKNREIGDSYTIEKNASTRIKVNSNLSLPTLPILFDNYPNPFNPTTWIDFIVPTNCYVSLVIYDVLGKKVESLIDGNLSAGYHKVKWLAGNQSSGVYFYQLSTPEFRLQKKMLLIH